MAKTLSPVARTAIASLCIAHMAAIFLYTLPGEAPEWMNAVRTFFDPVTRPYILAASQWQQWNLFSPDPLRRVTDLRIDARRDGVWTMRRRMKPEHYGFFQRASWQKYIVNILGDDEPSHSMLKERYLQSQCPALELKSGTSVQLVLEQTTLPTAETVHSIAWWNDTPMPVIETTVASTVCP